LRLRKIIDRLSFAQADGDAAGDAPSLNYRIAMSIAAFRSLTLAARFCGARAVHGGSRNRKAGREPRHRDAASPAC